MTPSKSIDFAREPVFTLGAVEVRPALHEIFVAGVTHSIEPRVMQVLVVLAKAQGVVSRDELIERCWDGRVVGENAINRVISQIRKLAATVGAGSFDIETITKVGYRLIVRTVAPAVRAQPAQAPILPASSSRRVILASGCAAAVVAIGYAVWHRNSTGRKPSSAAESLYRKGVEALRQELVEQNLQATAYLRQATERDPNFSAAWGALALSYSKQMEFSGETEFESLSAWCRSAAQRALALDPKNADANIALLLMPAYFRHWTALDAGCRRLLDSYPSHWWLQEAFGELMFEVGRLGAAVKSLARLKEREPFLPMVRWHLIEALWATGQLQQVENELDQAFKIWPGHLWLWQARFNFLALAGRPAAALALGEDIDARPVGRPPMPFELGIVSAKALQSRNAEDIARAIGGQLSARQDGTIATPIAVLYLAAFGAFDIAFQMLNDYFLGKSLQSGGARQVPRPNSRRYTNILFAAPLAPLRKDPRFAVLVQAIGLEDYWRATSSLPDYRR